MAGNADRNSCDQPQEFVRTKKGKTFGQAEKRMQLMHGERDASVSAEKFFGVKTPGTVREHDSDMRVLRENLDLFKSLGLDEHNIPGLLFIVPGKKGPPRTVHDLEMRLRPDPLPDITFDPSLKGMKDYVEKTLMAIVRGEREPIYATDITNNGCFTSHLTNTPHYVSATHNNAIRVTPGDVTVPLHYFAGRGSICDIHVEPGHCDSAILGHWCEGLTSKYVIVVAEEDFVRLNEVVYKDFDKLRSAGVDLAGFREGCSFPLYHKKVVLTPSYLDRNRIRYQIVALAPGDLLYVGVRSYHYVVNPEVNHTESANIGSTRWALYDTTACSPCGCADGKIMKISFDASNSKSVTCPEPGCTFRTDKRNVYKAHELHHTPGAVNAPLYCGHCHAAFKTETTLETHFRKFHSNNPLATSRLMCKHCKKLFYRTRRDAHEKKCGEFESCEYCHERFDPRGRHNHVMHCPHNPDRATLSVDTVVTDDSHAVSSATKSALRSVLLTRKKSSEPAVSVSQPFVRLERIDIPSLLRTTDAVPTSSVVNVPRPSKRNAVKTKDVGPAPKKIRSLDEAIEDCPSVIPNASLEAALPSLRPSVPSDPLVPASLGGPTPGSVLKVTSIEVVQMDLSRLANYPSATVTSGDLKSGHDDTAVDSSRMLPTKPCSRSESAFPTQDVIVESAHTSASYDALNAAMATLSLAEESELLVSPQSQYNFDSESIPFIDSASDDETEPSSILITTSNANSELFTTYAFNMYSNSPSRFLKRSLSLDCLLTRTSAPLGSTPGFVSRFSSSSPSVVPFTTTQLIRRVPSPLEHDIDCQPLVQPMTLSMLKAEWSTSESESGSECGEESRIFAPSSPLNLCVRDVQL